MPYFPHSFGFSSSIDVALSPAREKSREESVHFLAGAEVGAITVQSGFEPASATDFWTTISGSAPPGEKAIRATSSRLKDSTALSRRSSGLLTSAETAASGTSAGSESRPA